MGYRVRPCDPTAAQELGRAVGVGATTAQVLLQRGLDEAEVVKRYLSPTLRDLSSPSAMADRDRATERLVHAIIRRERIAVFGDYDVDGATSAAIFSDVLEALGGDVVGLVANRFEGGYGFSGPALQRCLDAGAKLIVTCDCGSSDHPRIADARRAGVDVIVVDHHLVPREPLPAYAFLNPHRPDCGYEYKGMCSAGLAFVMGASLRTKLGAKLDLKPWLDLVALGTVADVAPLDGDNRRLVRAGLTGLSKPIRPGVVALREAASMSGPVGAFDIAFRLAPRLNAPGRLADPAVTLALLRARTLDEARPLAARIEQLNEERKAVEKEVTEAAVAQVIDTYGEDPAGGLVVVGEGWHRGVVGITAARLVDRFHRPAVVIGTDGTVGHGSGRTFDGFDLYDALKAASEGLDAFGGHRAAVGLSLKVGAVERFRAAFFDACAQRGARQARKAPVADVCLDGVGFLPPTGHDLWRLEPLGHRNPEPLFSVSRAKVMHKSAVGDEGKHLKLRLRLGRDYLPAFGYELGAELPKIGTEVDAIGQVRFDPYRGGNSVELRLSEVKPPS
ncbi:MAG: single-stranded-DNA-specific exonuclease RecJ [Myxococcota bacterium]